MRTLLAALLTLLSASAAADQFRHSTMSVWTESETHRVLHHHDTQRKHSELRIVRKHDGQELFRGESAPFTLLVPVQDGRYFAALSNHALHAFDYGYNFALFTPQGEQLSRAYVSTSTGYCGRVRSTVSMYVYWFTQTPDVRVVEVDGKPDHVLVGRRCRFPMGDFRETTQSYNLKAEECRRTKCWSTP